MTGFTLALPKPTASVSLRLRMAARAMTMSSRAVARGSGGKCGWVSDKIRWQRRLNGVG